MAAAGRLSLAVMFDGMEAVCGRMPSGPLKANHQDALLVPYNTAVQ